MAAIAVAGAFGAAPGVQVPIAFGGAAFGLLVTAMAVSWLLAIIIALWGAIHDGQRAERERRHELRENPEPGPTPGIEGFLERWTLWSFGLVALGFLLLILATRLA